MEIGHQPVENDFGPVTERDENVGIALEGMDGALVVRGAFQQPQACRAAGHESSAPSLDLVDGGGAPAPINLLGVHFVIFRVVRLDRQKRTRADVQGDREVSTPRSSMDWSRRSVKCNPAVGAATAPGFWANMVW